MLHPIIEQALMPHVFGLPRVEPPAHDEPPVEPTWQALEGLPCEYQERVKRQFLNWADDELLSLTLTYWNDPKALGRAITDKLDALVAAAMEAARAEIGERWDGLS